jgi:hypothetical protein
MTKEIQQNYEVLKEDKLDDKIYVRLVKNKDTDVSYIDIRSYYKTRPTKKGIRLHTALFNKLKTFEFDI